MKIKEQISIDEFDGKRFQVRLVEPSDDSKAVLTHYLHNIHNGVSKHYKKDALKVLKEYVEYKIEDENISMVAQGDLTLGNNLININTLSAGIYFIKIMHGNEATVHKVCVE
jgi:hypothetical protein